jgi:hypothetical protein
VSDVPKGSRKLPDRSELSSALQRIVIQAKLKEQVWSSWTDGHRVWLFTAEMSLPLSRERGLPVLQVSWYGEHGEATKSGSWVCDREGKWRRCSD